MVARKHHAVWSHHDIVAYCYAGRKYRVNAYARVISYRCIKAKLRPVLYVDVFAALVKRHASKKRPYRPAYAPEAALRSRKMHCKPSVQRHAKFFLKAHRFSPLTMLRAASSYISYTRLSDSLTSKPLFFIISQYSAELKRYSTQLKYLYKSLTFNTLILPSSLSLQINLHILINLCCFHVQLSSLHVSSHML